MVAAPTVPVPVSMAPQCHRAAGREARQELQRPRAGEDDAARGRAEVVVGAHGERARRDRGAAAIGISRGQDGGAAAELGESAGSGDDAAEGQRVGAVDGEDAVVGDVAGNRSARAAIAELQGAGVDRGSAGIAAVAGEDQRSRASLPQRAGAGDVGTEGRSVGEVGDDLPVVGDRRGVDRASQATGPRLSGVPRLNVLSWPMLVVPGELTRPPSSMVSVPTRLQPQLVSPIWSKLNAFNTEPAPVTTILEL